MTTDRAHPIADPEIPAFDALMGSDVPAPVSAVFDEYGSMVLDAARVQVTWNPGRRLTVRYRVTARNGPLDGTHQVVATAGRIPEGALIVDGPDGQVGLWVVPHDPGLPGLASVLDRATLDALLPTLGLDEPVGAVALRAYRPTRRAVVEVRTSARSLFFKVVPPREVGPLHRAHRHLAPHLPVPDSLGFSEDLGIVVMAPAPGVNLRDVLRTGRAAWPDPATVASIVSHLPVPPTDAVRPSSLERLDDVVGLLTRLVPDEGERLRALAASIGSEETDARAPIHGDFHEAQVMVADGHVVGLLDVDTYAWGHAGDDPATMLGHLSCLAPGAASPQRVREFALGLNRIWDTQHPPGDLRRRAAAVVLGLATGPFRVQSPNWRDEVRNRIAIAESWVSSARAVDERSLIGGS